MFGFGKPKDAAGAFWDWFEKSADRIEHDARGMKNGVRPSALLIEGIGGRLRKVHPGLVHEIGVHEDGRVELIISADGVKAAFPSVIAVSEAAPALPAFRITAFRPRQTIRPILEFAGHRLSVDEVLYLSEEDGEKLGLTLYFDVPAPMPRELIGAGFILLDTVLGEFDVETGISHIEFETGRPAGAKPLSALAEEYDAFRAASVH